MSDLSEKFYIIGHRGAAGERFENSLEGFKHALSLDIDAIELDIREHSSELWVFHDNDLERLTGTAGLFADHPDPSRIRLRNGEPVPRLKQVLDLYWDRMPVNIEIKSLANPGLLLDLLDQYPAPQPADDLSWILISSFDHDVILKLKQLGCGWSLAPISSGSPAHTAVKYEQISPISWHFDDKYLDFDLVSQLREQGVKSLVFTVNDIERANFLKQHGVAGVFTDIPSKMVKTV